jgi:hypothetical protein
MTSSRRIRSRPRLNRFWTSTYRRLAARSGLLPSRAFPQRVPALATVPRVKPRVFEIYAKAPGQRTTIIHTRSGDNTTTCDGHVAWVAAPLRPLAVMPLTGGELEGAKMDAEMGFPARIKQTLSKWGVERLQGAGGAGYDCRWRRGPLRPPFRRSTYHHS